MSHSYRYTAVSSWGPSTSNTLTALLCLGWLADDKLDEGCSQMWEIELGRGVRCTEGSGDDGGDTLTSELSSLSTMRWLRFGRDAVSCWRVLVSGKWSLGTSSNQVNRQI